MHVGNAVESELDMDDEKSGKAAAFISVITLWGGKNGKVCCVFSDELFCGLGV